MWLPNLAIKLEAQPPARMDKAIHAALLKNDSIANQLDLSFAGQGPTKNNPDQARDRRQSTVGIG
jgi:hypothetical protein